MFNDLSIMKLISKPIKLCILNMLLIAFQLCFQTLLKDKNGNMTFLEYLMNTQVWTVNFSSFAFCRITDNFTYCDGWWFLHDGYKNYTRMFFSLKKLYLNKFWAWKIVLSEYNTFIHICSVYTYMLTHWIYFYVSLEDREDLFTQNRDNPNLIRCQMVLCDLIKWWVFHEFSLSHLAVMR